VVRQQVNRHGRVPGRQGEHCNADTPANEKRPAHRTVAGRCGGWRDQSGGCTVYHSTAKACAGQATARFFLPAFRLMQR
jgi:hypothetical protein